MVQPSVRFKLDFFNDLNYSENDKYAFSSIAFSNVSIVEAESNCNIAEKIDIVIEYLSTLGIHASRVNFVLEDKIKEKENNVKYMAIKFFVDNLEIGDILFFKTNNGYLTEYGFGLERLLSRVLNT